MSISENGILLEGAMKFEGNQYDVPLIFGEFNIINAATFVNCRIRSFTTGSGGYHVRIFASYMIENSRLSLEELKFTSMRFSCKALSKWLINDEFIEQIDDNQNKYEIPPLKKIVDVKVDDVSVMVEMGYRTKMFNFTKLIVEEDCIVSIFFDETKELASFDVVVRRLKRLLLFLLNMNPEIESINVEDEKGEWFGIKTINDNLKISSSVNIDHHSIGDSLNQVFHKWLSVKELETVTDLILIQVLNSEISVQSRFLNTCIAWESFHQRFGGEAAVDQVKINNREHISDLIKQDKELLAWFRKESTHWKNPTLKERLSNFATLIDVIRTQFLTSNVKEFIKKVVDSRNDIAHKGEYLNQFNLIELNVAARILDYGIRVEILKVLGVDTTAIEKTFAREIKWIAFSSKLKQIG